MFSTLTSLTYNKLLLSVLTIIKSSNDIFLHFPLKKLMLHFIIKIKTYINNFPGDKKIINLRPTLEYQT